MSISRWKGKDDKVHRYNGILLGHDKEGNSVICDNMDGSWGHDAKWNQFSSVQFSRSVVSDSSRPHESQRTRPPCPSPTPRVYSFMFIESVMPPNHLILCCPLLLLPSSFPISGVFFPSEQFFTSGGQTIGVSASASVFPMNIQDLFPLGLTGLIPLQSKGLSRVFFNITVQKHQFFSTVLSL